MMPNRLTALLALALISVASIQPGWTQYSYPVLGVGRVSCEEWITSEEGRKEKLFTWVQGYMTGAAAMTTAYELSDSFINADFAEIVLSEYCNNNPSATLEEASLELYLELRDRSEKHNDTNTGEMSYQNGSQR